METYIAFDKDRRQIKYGIVSEIGTLLEHQIVPTESHLGGDQIVRKLMNLYFISGTGISTAGIVDVHKDMITGGVDHIPRYTGILIVDKL